MTLEQHDFYFNPKVISGTAGQTVTIDLKNDGKVEHNFSVPSQSISQSVQPGQTASVKVTFPQSGTVQFFCKFHKAMGMTGTLTLSGSSSSGGTTTGTTTTSSYTSTGY